MNTITDILVMLLRCAVCGTEIPQDLRSSITDGVITDVFVLAKKHDLMHVVADVIVKNKLATDAETIKICRDDIIKYAMTYEYQQGELNRICKLFEDNCIKHIPLKGSVIRSLYSEPWHRSCCDIDILVHKEDMQQATELLVGILGYSKDKRTSVDMGLWSKSDVHVELHHDLIADDIKKNGQYTRKWKPDVLRDVWISAKPDNDNEYRYILSDEMFYFYHIAHMAKHFENGGCGIKPFMDLWLLNNKLIFSRINRENLLKSGGLLTFEKGLMCLCNAWFSGSEHNKVSRLIAEYIIGAGVYGDLENSVAFNRSKTGGHHKYLLSRVFPSIDLLKSYYPELEKKPYLLPFCQVGRWINIISKGRTGRSVKEIQLNSKISTDKSKSVTQMIEMLEL